MKPGGRVIWLCSPGRSFLTSWRVQSIPGKIVRLCRHRIRIGRLQQDITGNGFSAIRFDPRKPAHTIRCMDSNLGMGGAMHWTECRRFSLPEFKRFSSFPDAFALPGDFTEGIRQIGNRAPPLFTRAIALRVRI
jgi:site-specific DNA-cytosine methylase